MVAKGAAFGVGEDRSARASGTSRRPSILLAAAPRPAKPTWPGTCPSCDLRRKCLPANLEGSGLETFSCLARVKRRVECNTALYRAGEAMRALYIVRVGAFKALRTSRDGTEKVTAFHLPGDILGIEAIACGVHSCDMLALEASEVCALPFDALQAMARGLPPLHERMLRAFSAGIQRDHFLVQRAVTACAEQRVALFLLDLADRYRCLGHSTERLMLPMTREDLANFLGLAPETISRALARFRLEGLASVQQREVILRDIAGMKRFVHLLGTGRKRPRTS